MTKTRRQIIILRFKLTAIFAGISALIIIFFNVAVFSSFTIAGQFFADSLNAQRRPAIQIVQNWLQGNIALEKIDPEIAANHQEKILERFNAFQQTFRQNLLVFDGLIFLITVILGYYYSYYALLPVERSMKKQEDFILDASHEIKTPIATIMAEIDALRLIQGDKLDPMVDEALKVISVETQNLSDLSQSLLDLSKLDQTEVASAQIDLSELVSTHLKSFKSVALKKNITLSKKVASAAVVQGNRQQLSQLLVILLDNALKYTPENGKIRVTLALQKKNAVLEVQDTGIGIPYNQQQKIFKRFYRFKEKETIDKEGSGLGLAIAKQIVQQHHGQIKVISQPGKGAVFQVTLPTQTLISSS